MPSKRKLAAQKKREEKRARKAARKQFILFCVEGNSEVKALGAPVAAMLDGIDPSLDVRFQVMMDRHRRTLEDERGGDVTSKFGVTPDTIERVIEKTFLMPFFRDSGLYPREALVSARELIFG
ncbi:MAG: hypothetical protein Q4C36_06105, partial [Coriobacteriia bacterium]|nr:hypothetical protein [Coriobacteriia bacterium]